MALLAALKRDSLDSNPPTAQLHISDNATDWLWAVFALMLLGTLVVLFWTHVQPRGQRAFHYIALAIMTVASIAYFSMASNLGQTAVRAEFARSHVGPITRNIFYVRYIQWFINAPLILLLLLLGTGYALSDIFITLFFIDVVVVVGLAGALTPSQYKWGYWTLGVAALFYVLFHVAFRGARSQHLIFRRGYIGGSWYITFLWLIYPITWAFCDGGNVISPTGEMIWYGILDILSGPVFLITHLWGVRSIDYNAFGFSSGKNTDYLGTGGYHPGVGTGVGAAGAGAAAGAATREKGLHTGPGTGPTTGVGTGPGPATGSGGYNGTGPGTTV